MAGVGRPGVVGDADPAGQAGDPPLGRTGNGLQGEVRVGERTAGGIVGGIEAETGEPEFGLGEFGDGRCVGAGEEQEVFAIWADADGGRGGGVDERGEGGGRLAVGGTGLRAEGRREHEGDEERETRGDEAEHGRDVGRCRGGGHAESSRNCGEGGGDNSSGGF